MVWFTKRQATWCMDCRDREHFGRNDRREWCWRLFLEKKLLAILAYVLLAYSASRLVTTAALAFASSPLEAKSHRRWASWSFSRFVSKRLKPAVKLFINAELVLDWAFWSCSSCKSPWASRTKLNFWKSHSGPIVLLCARSSASNVLIRSRHANMRRERQETGQANPSYRTQDEQNQRETNQSDLSWCFCGIRLNCKQIPLKKNTMGYSCRFWTFSRGFMSKTTRSFMSGFGKRPGVSCPVSVLENHQEFHVPFWKITRSFMSGFGFGSPGVSCPVLKNHQEFHVRFWKTTRSFMSGFGKPPGVSCPVLENDQEFHVRFWKFSRSSIPRFSKMSVK